MGDPAPWLVLDPELRRIDADLVRAALVEREPTVLLTGIPPRRRHAAVLVPLYPDADGALRVILTRRSPHLRSHTHQVSFPGGSQDEGETLWETALREAQEETALDPELVEWVGELDRIVTFTTGAGVHPFVGLLAERPALVPNPDEVERIIDVPLAELTSEGIHREELWRWSERLGEQPVEIPDERPIHFFELEGDTVWGATAAILHHLILVCLGFPDPRPRPLTP